MFFIREKNYKRVFLDNNAVDFPILTRNSFLIFSKGKLEAVFFIGISTFFRTVTGSQKDNNWEVSWFLNKHKTDELFMSIPITSTHIVY